MFSSAPETLCILRLSALGDVCNAIAAVKGIKSIWPNTKIVWVAGSVEAKLLSGMDGVEVVILDKKQGIKGYFELWQKLKHYHFDALLHMQYSLRANIASIGIKAKCKLGFDKSRSKELHTLFTNVKVPSPSSLHTLDGFISFAHQLGIKDIVPQWGLDYSNDDLQWAKSHLDKTKPNLMIVPGTAKSYKNWHAQGYAEVIRYAHQKGWNVILAGSSAHLEVALARDVQQLCAEQPVLDLVGQSSLSQMVALIDQVDLVIAPDTGPVHMANSLSTPVIGLYAHHNPQRVGPYHYLDYVVSVYEQAILAETGKSSSELTWRARVKDKNAMAAITSESVIAAFDRMVGDFYPQYV